MNLAVNLREMLGVRTPERALVRARELAKAGEHKKALPLFVAAADAGIAEAIHEVGQCYLQGQGVHPSTMEAARWFSRAAERGHVPSMCQLASLHLAGLQASALQAASLFTQVETPEADFAGAAKWARRAAETGAVEAKK